MLLSFLPVVLGAVLRVEGAGTCPDPAEVSADVQRVVDLSDESAQNVHATLSHEGAWLVLRFNGSDGSSLGERHLAYEGDCTVLARAAAVVFAAWLSEEHPEFLVSLPLASESVQPSEVAVRPSKARPSLQPPLPAPVPPPHIPPRVVDPRPSPSATPAARHRFSLAAGLGGVSNGAQFAPAAWLGLSWDPSNAGFGARLSIAWTGTRSRDLQDHQVTWSRWPVLAGPYLRFTRAKASFDLEGGGALAWLRVGGHHFSTNASHQDASVGAYARLMFMPRHAPWHAFLSVTPVLWFGRATAVARDANGTSTAAKVPSFEALFALGAQLPL